MEVGWGVQEADAAAPVGSWEYKQKGRQCMMSSLMLSTGAAAMCCTLHCAVEPVMQQHGSHRLVG